MPFYEYQCTACSHRLEALQKISDEPLQHCPECGAGKLKKLVSKSAFRLKGAGWYETDFKNSGSTADKRDQDDNQKSSAQKNNDKESTNSKPTKDSPQKKPSDHTADKKTNTAKKSSSASESTQTNA